MKSNVIKNTDENTTNKILGSYITSMHTFPDRSYISIGVKDGTETIYIMIFKRCGYGNKKYDNPTVKIVMDAFSKGIPIAFVYTESKQSNVMVCAYTNFSVDTSRVQTVVAEEKTAAAVEDFAEVTDDGDLPF